MPKKGYDVLMTNGFLLAKRNYLILVHYSNLTYKFFHFELIVYRIDTWHFTVKRVCAVMFSYAGFLSFYFLRHRRAEAFQKQKTTVDSAFYFHMKFKWSLNASLKQDIYTYTRKCSKSYFSPNCADCKRLFISRETNPLWILGVPGLQNL